MRIRCWVLLLLLSVSLPGQTPTVREERRKPPAKTTDPGPPVRLEKPKTPDHSSVGVTLDSVTPAFSSYRVGPEDLISVIVLDSPEFTRQVRVSGPGTIRLPLVQQAIPVAGKTVSEVESEIARALVEEGLLREPSVSVTVREFHSKPVSISGAVRDPIVFQAARPLTLAEAISRAGGLSESAGPEVIVSIPERDGEPARNLRVAVKSLLELSDPKDNLWLSGGEEVRVPPAGHVYVLGGVTRPGAVLINTEQPMTVLQALALSGGPTPAAAGKAYLLRPAGEAGLKQEIALDLRKLLKQREPDVPLRANDVIFIPDSKAKKAAQASWSAGLQSAIYGFMGWLVWR